MKLTWFGDTTMRIHIGGRILVADPDLSPPGIDRRELLSGVDRAFGLGSADPRLSRIDPAAWRPRAPGRPIDEDASGAEVEILLLEPGAVLVAAPGEPPLVLIASAAPPRFGRWADNAVVVLFGAGEGLVATATVLLDVARPRLIALAADGAAVDLAIAELREHLDGAALVSMEPGLAVEV